LGLPICRSIIEEHGGRIWAEVRAGGGAVFAFSLKIDSAGAD
jgi:signal transduction histidine kinase